MRAAILDQRIASVSYDWDGEDNASPSVQQVNGAAVRRNMANNPRFTRTSGTVEVRRNYALNPASVSSTLGSDQNIWNGFGGIGVASWVDADWSLSGKARRNTCTTEPTSTPASQVTNLNTKIFTAGVWTVAQQVKYSSGLLESGTSLTEPGAGNTLTANGTTILENGSRIRWATINLTLVGVGWTGNPRIDFSINKQGYAVGSVLEIGAVDIYPGEYQPNRHWFSGSYSPDPDLSPVWVGTENASQSYLRGFVPVNTGDIRCFVVSSSNGLRHIPNSTVSSESAVYVGGSSSSLSGHGVTFTPGKWYGFQVVCTLLAPQTGTIVSFARKIRFVSNNADGWIGAKQVFSIQPPNEAGSYQEEIVTQLQADAVWVSLLLYNGASFGGGDVYWDKLLIVEGDTEGEVRHKLAQGYFDGDTQVNAETINKL